MNMRPVSEWTIYKLRFAIAYALLAAIAAVLLSLALGVIPPGLSDSEASSVVTSHAISFTQLPTNVVDLPYHALQKLSVDWLGVTPLGVRLPSLIFGGLTALCMTLLLRRWFRFNIAVAASFILITGGWFLTMARFGTPVIMIPFWTSLLLLTATYVTQETKAWKWWRVAFALSTALSLYTPFMSYLFISIGLAIFTQPHLRYLLKEGSKANLFIGSFFFLLLLAPLGWGLYHNLGDIGVLLAIPANIPDPLQFGADLFKAASALVNPWNTQIGEVITPYLSIVSVALLLAGGARLLRDFHSVRAHVLLIWAAVMVPVVGLNPGNLAILFVPAMLVMTIGLNQIIRYWYKLFPLNPYARVFGLIPLCVLLFSIVQFNYQRYVYGMLYAQQASAAFNQDAFLVQAEIAKAEPKQPITVIMPDGQKPIYDVIAARHTNVSVAETPAAPTERQGRWLVAAPAQGTLAPILGTAPIQKMLVTNTQNDSLRFLIYQR